MAVAESRMIFLELRRIMLVAEAASPPAAAKEKAGLEEEEMRLAPPQRLGRKIPEGAAVGQVLAMQGALEGMAAPGS